MRVLIAGVGYPFLRDLSVGPVLVPELQQLEWPAGVEIEDWSIGAIHIVQRLEVLPEPYDRIIFVSAVARQREPGQVYRYQWHGELPDAAEIQARVGEAVMGIISLDNLLIICQHFDVLPPDVVVIEVEPEDIGWGPGFTPCVEAALNDVVASVRREVHNGHNG